MRALAESKLWWAGWLWGFADILEGGRALPGKHGSAFVSVALVGAFKFLGFLLHYLPAGGC